MTSPGPQPVDSSFVVGARRRTSPAIAGLLGGAVGLFLLGTALGHGWLRLAACLLGAVPVAAAVLTPKPHRMSVLVRVTPRLTARQPVSALIGVRACSHGSPEARLTLTHPGLLPVEVLVPALPSRGVAGVEIELTAPSRGAWTDVHAQAHVDVWSPWRLWSRRMTVRVPLPRLLVRPPAAPPGLPPPNETTTEDGSGRRQGHGLDIYGVRDWKPGDGAAAVHWRTSARQGRLAVLERTEQVDRMLVVVVAAHTLEPGLTEALLAHAYASVVRHVDAGGTVQLLAAESVLSTRRTGEVGDWFAAVNAAAEPAAADLARLTRRGADVLWVGTPSPAARAALVNTRLTVADRLRP